MKPYLLLTFLLFGTFLNAQKPSYEDPQPSVSMAELVMEYITIDWNDEQWEELAGQEVGLTYLIDKSGRAELRDVRGLSNQSLIDSFYIATDRLPPFSPGRQDGIAVETILSFSFTFPAQQAVMGEWLFGPPVLEREILQRDFTKTYNAIYVDFTPAFVDHFGNLDEYLKPGFGFDIYVGGHWNERWGAALFMVLEGNGKRQPFPEDEFPERDEISTGISIGLAADRVINSGDRGLTYIRSGIGYAAFNAANRLNPDSKEGWVQYRGIQIDASFNHSIRIGKYTPNYYYGGAEASARYSAINFSAGLRYRVLNGQVGNSWHWFVGVGYRFGRDDFVKSESPATYRLR
ncbi:MAG: hypothetical protein AAGF87_10095 [Bacteroidota bacterium]